MLLLRWTAVLLVATLVSGVVAVTGLGGLGGVARPLALIYAILLGLTALRAVL